MLQPIPVFCRMCERETISSTEYCDDCTAALLGASDADVAASDDPDVVAHHRETLRTMPFEYCFNSDRDATRFRRLLFGHHIYGVQAGSCVTAPCPPEIAGPLWIVVREHEARDTHYFAAHRVPR